MIHENWKLLLAEEVKKEYFLDLKAKVKVAYSKDVCYPHEDDIFNALKFDPKKIKVVILGQDPYHQEGQAHGLSFSVKTKAAPPSLQNIFKELEASFGTKPKSNDLTPWAEQGVLLLNTYLTVKESAPLSHKNFGWETFTDKIISLISENNKNVIFLLWGAHAKGKSFLIDKNNHYVLMSAHPSPLSAHKGFLGCGHFLKTNEILRSLNEEVILWT